MIAAALRDAWTPRDTRPIHEWARDNIELTGDYALPGPFDVAPSRHLIEPFNAIQERRSWLVCVVAPTQTGKTLLADVAVPWHIQNRPGPIMWNMQAEDIAKDHATSRLLPVLRACKGIAPLLPRDPRKLGKKVLELPHMTAYIQGGTPSKLQSKSIMLSINDELWRWKPGRWQWALARVGAFRKVGMAKVLVLSQADYKDGELWEVWRSGTMEEWTVPCPACGEYFAPRWQARRPDGTAWGMLWDTNEHTRTEQGWFWDALLPTIRYRAPCAHEFQWGPKLVADWNNAGRYLATNATPQPGHRSFHWSGIAIEPWTGLVAQWLQAREQYHAGIIEPQVMFILQRLAEFYTADIDAGEQVHGAGDPWEVEEGEIAHVIMGVDVQADGYWVEIRTWLKNGDSRQEFFGFVTDDGDLFALQEKHKIPNHCVFVDVRWQRPDPTAPGVRTVYKLVAERGWCGLRGDDKRRAGYTHVMNGGPVLRLYSRPRWGDPQAGTKMQGRRFAKYFEFASMPVKKILARLRDGRGSRWHSLPSPEYSRQMFSERLTRKGCVERWEQYRRDNHAWDTGQIQVVAALMSPRVDLSETPKLAPEAQRAAQADAEALAALKNQNRKEDE